MDFEELFDIDRLVEDIKERIVEDGVPSFSDIINIDASANREVFIGGIGPGLGSSIDGYIRFWNKYDEEHNIPVEERKPIKLYIDSPGGDLIETLIMVDSMKLSKTPVWTICMGAAYSGGFFTFISGHKRIAYPNSSYMFHEGSVGQVADAGKFRNFTDFYYKQLDLLKDITIGNSNITEELYEEHKKDDWWFTAKEGMEHGFVDEIATSL